MMGRGGIGNIMKQAQQMQKRMGELQKELESREVEASAGGGMVTAVVSGKQQLLRLNIDPAIAGGVVLTTITDVTGFFVFLGLATLVYA